MTLLARNLAPYLGQIAPVAVFTAREGARSVYPGVFGRAVLATLPIGLPRPFLLRRAADIGPTVKTHCLFPPSLREPDGHATYTQRHENDRWLVPVCVCASVLSITPPRFRFRGSVRPSDRARSVTRHDRQHGPRVYDIGICFVSKQSVVLFFGPLVRNLFSTFFDTFQLK